MYYLLTLRMLRQVFPFKKVEEESYFFRMSDGGDLVLEGGGGHGGKS